MALPTGEHVRVGQGLPQERRLKKPVLPPPESMALELLAKFHILDKLKHVTWKELKLKKPAGKKEGVQYVADYSENSDSRSGRDSEKETLLEKLEDAERKSDSDETQFDKVKKKTGLTGDRNQLVPIGIFLKDLEKGIRVVAASVKELWKHSGR